MNGFEKSQIKKSVGKEMSLTTLLRTFLQLKESRHSEKVEYKVLLEKQSEEYQALSCEYQKLESKFQNIKDQLSTTKKELDTLKSKVGIVLQVLNLDGK
jgi:archaellum component FlaC